MFRELSEVPRTLWTIVLHALASIKHNPVAGTLRFPLHLGHGLYLSLKRHTTMGRVPVLKSDRYWQRHHPPSHSSCASIVTKITDTLVDTVDTNHWSGFRGARLSGTGNVTRLGPWRSCGIVRKRIPVMPGQAYQVTLETQGASVLAELCCVIHDTARADTNDPWEENQIPLPVHADSGSPRRILFRVFSSCTAIDVYLILRNCAIGEGVRVDRFALEQIDLPRMRPDLPPHEKIIASLTSIPAREHWLQDTVTSLLPQVDEVRVFLDGYDDIPEFLQGNDQIRIKGLRETDARGDAGKFFWADDAAPGYRFICDDDIVYPVDYVFRMIKRLQHYHNAIILGAHGKLLKQPLTDDHAPHARHTIGCRDSNPHDRSCHLLGTGTLAYHRDTIRISLADFPTPNMADSWFAKAAHEQQVPLTCISHAENWLIVRTATGMPDIHGNSHDGKSSDLDTTQRQTDILRSLYPISVPKSSDVLTRKKVILAIKTFNRLPYLKDCLLSFERTCHRGFDWVVFIADDGSTDGTRDYLDTLELPFETHLIRNQRRYAVGQCNTIFRLASTIGFDFGFIADDDLVFLQSGWDSRYIEAAERSGYDHLCFLDHRHYRAAQQRNNPTFDMPEPQRDTSQTCEAYVAVERCMGALFTFTPRMIAAVGYADEENFPVRGQWHIDLSMRACRANLNDAESFYDIVDSNDCLTLQNNLEEQLYRFSTPWNAPQYQEVREADELARRNAVIHDESRVYLSPARGKSHSEPETF